VLIQLLKYLSNKENYENCIKYVKETFVPKEAWVILKNLPKFPPFVSGSPWTYTDFYTWFALSNPGNKTLPILQTLCTALDAHATLDIDDSIVQSFVDQQFAEKIIQEAEKVLDNAGGNFTNIQSLIVQYKAQSVKLEKSLTAKPILTHYDYLFGASKAGYDFSLPCLNTLLGPLSSELIIVGARPDGGKTTFLVQEAVHIAKQLPKGKCVLWFNNEEAINKIFRRIVQNALTITSADVEADKISALRQYERTVGKDKIILIDDAHDWQVINNALDTYSPGLIIIDQLYKVKGESTDGLEAEQFRVKCSTAREIAKHVCPVIVSNQLDGTAEGVQYPPMGTLYGSKTGAQGEADAIVLIGRDRANPDKRYLYTPKNKLTGRSSDYYELTLDTETARFI
jgi:replicative DNA helicase